MATIESVMAGAREHLRDYPKMFTTSVVLDGVARTFNLTKPNVRQAGLTVLAVHSPDAPAVGVHSSNTTPVSPTVFKYDLDEREGLLRIVQERTGGLSGWTLLIEGYYVEWVSDESMRFWANNVIAEHGWHRENFDLNGVSDTEEDALSLGAAFQATWSLLQEFARDIDVTTVEGVHVPASARFRQLQSLMFGPGGLGERYSELTNALGIGLRSIEVGVLRRQSRTTGRLVPIYREREWEDQRWPQRVFPPISTPGPLSPPPGFRTTVIEE